MIVFDLFCHTGHRFEAWFRSTAAYEEQVSQGQVVCPECGDTHVRKAVTAARINRSGAATPGADDTDAEAMGAEAMGGEDMGVAAAAPPSGLVEVCDMAAGAPDLPEPLRRELDQVMNRVRAHVEAHCDYVGDRFPEEVRAMHYGEAEPRGIYGEATTAEAADMIDEGIDITPLPHAPRRRQDA